MLKGLWICFALGACTTTTSTGISSVSCPPDSTLTYANFGSSFMANNCLSCHASRDRPTLATHAQVQANATSILQMAVYTNAMPQNTDMALAERQTLGEWLACGAP